MDTFSTFETNIAQHRQIYPADSDGHLQSAGYGVIAEVVAEAVPRYAPKP